MLGLGLLVLLAVLIRYKSTELEIKNERIVAKYAFIRRSTVGSVVRKIESIQVHQRILGRLFNFGSVVMAGAGNQQALLQAILQPMKFRRQFLEHQETAA